MLGSTDLSERTMGHSAQVSLGTAVHPSDHYYFRYRRAASHAGNFVREKGVEPLSLPAPDPKSGASANSATLAKRRLILANSKQIRLGLFSKKKP